MILRRTLLAAFAAASSLFLTSSTLYAAKREFFDADMFYKYQAANERIVVEVTAPWCPTCRAQKPIIDKLSAAQENKDLIILMVDFDTQKDALKVLGVRSQSTLIAYKGKNETGRSAGDTKEESITSLFNSTK